MFFLIFIFFIRLFIKPLWLLYDLGRFYHFFYFFIISYFIIMFGR